MPLSVTAAHAPNKTPDSAVRGEASLVGYADTAFVAITADAAAIPDLDMLAGCIREGFDAVIALDDVS